jgi:MFS family permease
VGGVAASPGIGSAAACAVILGLGNGAAVVSNALLVQRGAPDRLRGRAFTVLMASTQICVAIGIIVAGRLTDAFGARWVWGYAAVILFGCAVIAWRLARALADAPTERGTRGAAGTPIETATGATPIKRVAAADVD